MCDNLLEASRIVDEIKDSNSALLEVPGFVVNTPGTNSLGLSLYHRSDFDRHPKSVLSVLECAGCL